MKRCELCNTEFEPRKYTKTPQRYCGRLCGARASAEARGVAQRKLADISCQGCKTMFRPSGAETKFCSRDCYLANGTTRRYVHKKSGYVIVWVPPGTPGRRTDGRMLEHRLVMQEALGRPLTSDEEVHHKDDNKSNNDLSNLQLRRINHGKGIVLCCAKCGSHDLVPSDL